MELERLNVVLQENHELRSKLSTQLRECNEAKKKLEDLEKQIADVRAKKEDAEKDIIAAKEAAAAEKGERMALEATLRVKEQTWEEQRQQLSTDAEATSALKQEVAVLRERASSLEDSLAAERARPRGEGGDAEEILALQDEVDAAEEEIEALKTEHEAEIKKLKMQEQFILHAFYEIGLRLSKESRAYLIDPVYACLPDTKRGSNSSSRKRGSNSS